MPNLGFGELVIVLLIVMLIFGAGRLPQIGEGLGKAIRNLKRGLNTDDDIDVTPTEKQVPNGSTDCGFSRTPSMAIGPAPPPPRYHLRPSFSELDYRSAAQS